MAGGDDDPKASGLEDDDDADPYYDLFDEYGPSVDEQLQNFVSSPNPSLMDLSFLEEHIPPRPPSPPPPMEINETGVLQELSLSIDTIDEILRQPFEDDLTMFDMPSDNLNNHNINNNFLGDHNGNTNGETTRLEMGSRVLEENSLRFETGSTSTIAPITSEGIHVCSCCNPLRVLVHSNGQETMRLDIHGGIGFFCHAIFEYLRVDGSTECRQTFHLKDFKMEEVKKFIEDYCSEREVSGFEVVQDTNAAFYQAINACSVSNQERMSRGPSQNDSPMSLAMPDEALSVPPLPLHVGLRDESPVLSKERVKRKTLSPLAIQRERTGKLTLKDIGMYFHLPIEEAARKLSLCPTVVKKICRKGGLPRWPHRKIKSLQKKISSLKSVLSTATDMREKARAEMEIERARREIDQICSESLKNCK